MAAYVSIYTRRQRVERARRAIAQWTEKLAIAEKELAEAERIGEPPQCMDSLCHNHSKFRVGGTEECCASHLQAAIQSVVAAGNDAIVEVWPWKRAGQEVDNELSEE